mgnify:CR=1 FL=1
MGKCREENGKVEKAEFREIKLIKIRGGLT